MWTRVPSDAVCTDTVVEGSDTSPQYAFLTHPQKLYKMDERVCVCVPEWSKPNSDGDVLIRALVTVGGGAETERKLCG